MTSSQCGVYGTPYDLANRLKLLTNHIDDTNSIVFDYNDYDAVGNRLSLKIDDANEQTFTYDNLYQLITVDYNDGNMVDYYYDPVGNRTSVVDTGTTNYTANNLNQYTAVGGTSYTYDNNGNLAYDGTYRYYYDSENRLTDVNDSADDPIASYLYDYRGRRIQRTIHGTPDVVTKYAYDGDQVIAEYDGSGTLLRKFIYGPGIDEPICMVDVADANETYYYHFDGLGSVVALSDVNNVLVDRYTYDVFGQPTIRDANGAEIAASAVGNPYAFTGRRYDPEAGLYYYRARYYDFATGRFLQPDPLGYADGPNLYAYVGNSPLSWADPSGLCKGEPWLQDSAAGRALLGLSGFGIGFGEAVTGFLGGAKHAITHPWTLSPLYQLLHIGDTVRHGARAGRQFGADITSPDALRNGLAIGRLTGSIFSAAAARQITRGITQGIGARASGRNPVQRPQSPTGQRHHAISARIHRATEGHRNLAGRYQARDPRFMTRARDSGSHRGYQRWHRALDNEVVQWIEGHQAASPAQFESFLGQRYSQPDLMNRFPNGLGGG